MVVVSPKPKIQNKPKRRVLANKTRLPIMCLIVNRWYEGSFFVTLD